MTQKKQTTIVMAFYIVCFMFRLLEYFVLRTDKTWISGIFMGLGFGVVSFTIAYGVEILISLLQGDFQALQIYVSAYAKDRAYKKKLVCPTIILINLT